MMLIPCPFCGPRNETEFAYGGPVGADRPVTATDEEFVEYLTIVPNPAGPVSERWWHVKGCGSWVTIQRDTRTHEILDDAE